MVDHQNRTVQPLNAMDSSEGTTNPIDLYRFQSQLKTFYSLWHEHKGILWGSSDAIAIATPPNTESTHTKSFTLNIWLFDYEFSETIMVFMKKQIHFLCSQNDASLLEIVKKPAKEAVDVDVIMHVKETSDDKISRMDFIFHAIAAESKVDGRDAPTIGYISTEASQGKFLQAWAEKLKKTNFHLSDVAKGLSSLFAVKTNEEITLIKTASSLTANVMKNFVVPKLWNVIDEKKKVSHSTLADETQDAILEPSRFNCKLKAEHVQTSYFPFFLSGIGLDLGYPVTNMELLHYDSASTIICAFGARYKYYCSSIARTFLIDPEPLQIKAYEVFLKAQEAAIHSLRPGNMMQCAYKAAVSVIENEAPILVSNLTTCAGTGIGIDYIGCCEPSLHLEAKNQNIVREGMVFEVILRFQNLDSQSCDSKTFSLLLADTVIVNKDMTEVATSWSSKALKDVLFSLNKNVKEKNFDVNAEGGGPEPFMSRFSGSLTLGLSVYQDGANGVRLPEVDSIHGRIPSRPESEEEVGHPPRKKQRALEGLSLIETLAPQQLQVAQQEAPTSFKKFSTHCEGKTSTSYSTQEVQGANRDLLHATGAEHAHATADPPPTSPERAAASTGISATYSCYKGMFDIPAEDLPYLETGLERYPQVLNWFNRGQPRFLSSSIYTMFAGVMRILRTTRVCDLTKEYASHVEQSCLLLEMARFDPTWIGHVRQNLKKCQERENMRQQLEEGRRQTDILRKKLAAAEAYLASFESKISRLDGFIEP